MTLYINPKPPESLPITIAQGASTIDLSTVTAARFDVQQPDKTTTTWSLAIDAKTPTELKAHHPFALGEATLPGVYILVPILVVPGGEVQCERVVQRFEDPFSRKGL